MCSCQVSTPAPKKFGYPRSCKLTRASDLEQVQKAGRRLRTEHLEVRVSDSLLSHARAQVIVGKHGRSIVERNRLRRRLRELMRKLVLPVAGAVDIVIRANASAYDVDFDQLKIEIEQIMQLLLKNELAG